MYLCTNDSFCCRIVCVIAACACCVLVTGINHYMTVLIFGLKQPKSSCVLVRNLVFNLGYCAHNFPKLIVCINRLSGVIHCALVVSTQTRARPVPRSSSETTIPPFCFEHISQVTFVRRKHLSIIPPFVFLSFDYGARNCASQEIALSISNALSSH